MRIGDYKVRVVNDGRFRLDGGAMFGIVPKPLWSRLTKPDRKNRIDLGLNLLLIEGRGKRLLVDTGFGDTWSSRERERYGLDGTGRLPERLAEVGVSVSDVDFVVNSHLHFDHAGGNCKDGEPLFPNGTYIVQETELNAALKPSPLSASSYRDSDIKPIMEREQLKTIEGDYEVLPGVLLLNTGGHTKGHQAVLIRSGGTTFFYPADLIPTRFHLNIPYIMGYDLYPEETVAQKERLLRSAVEEGWFLLFEHDVEPRIYRVEFRSGRYRPILEEPL